MRANGITIDCLMEEDRLNENLKLSQAHLDSDQSNSTKLEIERQSSTVSFSTQNFNNTDFKIPVAKKQNTGQWVGDHFQSHTQGGIGMIRKENSILVDYDVSLNDNQ